MSDPRHALELIPEGDDLDRELHLLTVRDERLLANHRSAVGPDVPTDRAPAVRRDRPAARERG
ncbi:hypothetical protein [Kribbella sp. NPDC051137]|uniref:hypothetical protein n=1 Tax=Kribbella sp. NPDC051137 TaxID=3155045 RepID=UPI002F736670